MCLKDLSERFAKVKIHSSPPIVPFRETISSTMVSSSESSSTEPMSEVVEVDDESFKLSLRAKAIEPEISLFLAKHMESLSAVLTDGTISDLSTRDESKDIWRKFRDLCKSSNEIDCDRYKLYS